MNRRSFLGRLFAALVAVRLARELGAEEVAAPEQVLDTTPAEEEEACTCTYKTIEGQDGCALRFRLRCRACIMTRLTDPHFTSDDLERMIREDIDPFGEILLAGEI